MIHFKGTLAAFLLNLSYFLSWYASIVIAAPLLEWLIRFIVAAAAAAAIFNEKLRFHSDVRDGIGEIVRIVQERARWKGLNPVLVPEDLEHDESNLLLKKECSSW